MSRPLRISIFLIIFGIVIAVLPGQFLYSKKQIENDGINVQAEIEKKAFSPDEPFYRVVLRYKTRTGVTITDNFETRDSYWKGIKTGDKVKVRYSRLDPREYYVFNMQDHNYIFVVIGALMLLSGIIIFIVYLKEFLWKIYELHELK